MLIAIQDFTPVLGFYETAGIDVCKVYDVKPSFLKVVFVLTGGQYLERVLKVSGKDSHPRRTEEHSPWSELDHIRCREGVSLAEKFTHSILGVNLVSAETVSEPFVKLFS